MLLWAFLHFLSVNRIQNVNQSIFSTLSNDYMIHLRGGFYEIETLVLLCNVRLRIICRKLLYFPLKNCNWINKQTTKKETTKQETANDKQTRDNMATALDVFGDKYLLNSM